MDDLISRQAMINALTYENIIEHMDSVYDSELHRFKRATERIIAQLPSAQPEIIHCKDCIHWINKHLCEIWSRYGTIETKPDFECGFRERRNNEHNEQY